jgi:TetR/AcrR family acrAB operon transcriptional repressor
MRKTKEEALKTRSTILKNAMKVFLEKGYAKSTLEDIAKMGGNSRGAVYWHFKNKTEILEVLITKFDDRFMKMKDEILSNDLTPMEKIVQAININLLALYREKEFRDFIELTWFRTESNQNSSLHKSKESIANLFNDTIAALIEEAADKGYMRDGLDAKIAALSITSLITGIFRGYFVMPDKLMVEDSGMALVNSYLSLITAENPTNR